MLAPTRGGQLGQSTQHTPQRIALWACISRFSWYAPAPSRFSWKSLCSDLFWPFIDTISKYDCSRSMERVRMKILGFVLLRGQPIDGPGCLVIPGGKGLDWLGACRAATGLDALIGFPATSSLFHIY